MWKIYGLVDPRDETIRYVGCTTMKYLSNRLSAHLDQSRHSERRGYNQRRSVWIREVFDAGLRPRIVQLQLAFTEEEGIEAECAWIARFRDQLVNETSGGPGAPNPTPERRAKMAEASRKWWESLTDEERIAKGQKTRDWIERSFSEAQLKKRMDYVRGFSHTPEANAKRSLSRSWYSPSEEVREKLRQAKLGSKQSSETVAKRAASMRATHAARRNDTDVTPVLCQRCKKIRPANEFNLHRTRSTGRQTYCRDCGSEYHQERKRRK